MTTVKTGIERVTAAITHPTSSTSSTSATKTTTKKGTTAETTPKTTESFTLGTRKEDEKTALSLGNDLSNLEELYIKAFRADPKNANAVIKEISDKLGIPESEHGSLSLDGLKAELQVRYQRSAQNLDAFMQLMKNRFEIFKSLVNKLDVR
jgi:hypothetical protein